MVTETELYATAAAHTIAATASTMITTITTTITDDKIIGCIH